MAYSEEVLRRARKRLEQARLERERENEARREEAYARYPRLAEIDRELRRTMTQLMATALRTGEDPAGAVARIRDKNLALQQERDWIVEAGELGEDWLRERPICEKCGGSGYVGAKMCSCLRELCAQEQKLALTSLLGSGTERFDTFRLDVYPDTFSQELGTSPRRLMQSNLRLCRKYAHNFTPASGSLLFSGATGLGKTFLSACIARTVTDRGYSVVYETSSHLFSKLEQAKFSPSDDTRREAAKLTNSDLLILDDLGTEMPGQFVTAALYSLLNDRMMAVKPMVISTNLNVDELSRRYSPQIASRLHGDFQRLTFVGNDIRVLKNRGL